MKFLDLSIIWINTVLNFFLKIDWPSLDLEYILKTLHILSRFNGVKIKVTSNQKYLLFSTSKKKQNKNHWCGKNFFKNYINSISLQFFNFVAMPYWCELSGFFLGVFTSLGGRKITCNTAPFWAFIRFLVETLWLKSFQRS